MKVHIVKSEEVSTDLYCDVIEFLQSFSGPVSFVAAGSLPPYNYENLHEEEVDQEKFFIQERSCCYNFDDDFEIPETRFIVNWVDLFLRVEDYRSMNQVKEEDFVILLTGVANEHNWFGALTPQKPNNGFVHTNEWEYYVRCNPAYPIAYLIASFLLQKHLYSFHLSLESEVHFSPLGCINDFCENKKEIILKLRTADICYVCMERIKVIYPPLVIQQVLDIFERVRTRVLFNQNFRQNLPASRLLITKAKKFLLIDYDNIEVKLTPLEKNLYLFFLQHPEGMMLHDLVDYKEELIAIYSSLSTSGTLTEIYNRIDDLANVNSNSASEKIAKIKKAFIRAIGKDLAKHYMICGENGELKKVHLPRNLIIEQ